MVSQEAIQQFADEIARRYSPEKIILFGSYARGTATEDSDVDLLVVMDYEGRSGQAVSNIRSNIRSHFPLDLLVRREKEMNWRIEQGDCFLQEVIDQGMSLYEASH